MQTDRQADRQSNIELIRIIAMLMIIAFHITRHCVQIQLLDANSIKLFQNGLFNNPSFYKKLLILETLFPLGKTGNGIFILITGFFMTSKSTISLISPIKKIMLQLAFAWCLLTVLSTIYYRNINEMAVGLVGIDGFNTASWFASYYLAIIIFASLFLNDFVSKFTKLQYVTALTVLFASISLGWLGGLLSGLSESLRIFATGIFLYMLGGYIRKYEPFYNIRTRSFIIAIILIFGFVWLTYYNKTISNINAHFLYKKSGAFKQITTGYSDFSIVPILLAICIFEIGKRMKIPYSPAINFVGSSTFMIYLMHENTFVRQIWRESDWITVYYHSPVNFCKLLATWTIITFCMGFLAYLLFLLFQKIIASKMFHRVIYKGDM